MPDRPPAMQGEVYAAEPRAPALSFSLGEALDRGVAGMRRDGVVLTVAQVLASVPGGLVAVAFRLALGQPHFGSRAWLERSLVLMACGAVVSSLFRGGLLRMALATARGARPRLADLARGARFFPAMLAFEVVHLVVVALSIPLLFVPYVLVWTAGALAQLRLVDRDEGFVDAVRWSFDATRGERLHLFGFLVATAVIGYLGVLACCVGAFPAAALTSVATAHVYLRLSGVSGVSGDGDAASAEA